MKSARVCDAGATEASSLRAPCGSCWSRRCTRARTRPTWACSSRSSSARCWSAATRSSGPCSTRARGGQAALPRRSRAAAREAARRFRPDVVYAHFLVPTGLVAALASSAPLVVTAHGRDVRNVGAIRGHRRAHPPHDPPRRGRDRRLGLPAARARGQGSGGGGKTQVIDSGRRPRALHRASRRRTSGPRFLCIGALTERKNVVRLADAFERLGGGDAHLPRRRRRCAAASRGGPTSTLRAQSGTTRSRRGSRAPTSSASRAWSSPSARRRSKRWRAAAPSSRRAIGGPPEFVPPEAGVLVDPLDVEALDPRAARRGGAAVPEPRCARRGRAARRARAGPARRGGARARRVRIALNFVSTSKTPAAASYAEQEDQRPHRRRPPPVRGGARGDPCVRARDRGRRPRAQRRGGGRAGAGPRVRT